MEHKAMEKKILVVDDEPDVIGFLKETLVHHGYEADIALTGEEALRCLEGKCYQALLIDMRLGSGISGVDVIKKCREMAQRPRILVISATPHRYLEPIFQEEGIRGLIDHVLEKPSDLKSDYLIGKLESILRRCQSGVR